jgi:hypothetical protein
LSSLLLTLTYQDLRKSVPVALVTGAIITVAPEQPI